MKRAFNMAEAKAQLSHLVDRAAEGEEIVIAKAGRPRARLVPLAPPKPHRVPGQGKGRIELLRGWDDPLPDDVLDAFEGRAFEGRRR